MGERDYVKAGAAGVELFVDRIRTSPGDTDALVIAKRPPGEAYAGV